MKKENLKGGENMTTSKRINRVPLYLNDDELKKLYHLKKEWAMRSPNEVLRYLIKVAQAK